MNLFLDANVLVSVLNKEYPVFTFSARILSLSNRSNYKLFTSPVCLAIAFYFSGKKSGDKVAREKIETLLQHVHVTTTDDHVVTDAINDKRINNFEDGIEYYSALSSKCTHIITENKKDFFFSKIEVFTSQQFLEAHVYN